MPNRRETQISTRKYDFGTATIYKLDRSLRWERSPKIGGKLRLQGNVHRRIDGRVPFHVAYREQGLGYTNAGGSVSNQWYGCMPENQVPTSLSNEVYARFRGKLYDGNASLGVTAGSYKQSRDMILTRYNTLTNRAGHWASAISSAGRGRRVEKLVAGMHLEVIFGWTPLLADIHAATTTVCQKADVNAFVKVRKSKKDSVSFTRDNGSNREIISAAVTYSEAWATTVRIANPNLWLAERAGLLNPAAVAWDLVPWSFVVNMFVNTGQLVNSLTDFSGLVFSDFTRTRTTQIDASVKVLDRWLLFPNCDAVHLRNTKNRERLPGPPGPRLTYKIPNMDASLLAMSASLFTQKFSTLARLISPTKTLKRA